MMTKPVSIHFGYTNNSKSVGNWAIRVGTGGSWAHTLVMFTYDDGSQSYYESISSVREIKAYDGQVYRKNGVGGPFPIGKLYQWVNAKPSKRTVHFQEVLGLTQDEIIEAEKFLQRHVPNIKYAKLQILQNARTLLTGRMGSAKRISPHAWTCSETDVRCMPAWWQIEAGVGDVLYDMITPSGKYSVMRMTEKINDRVRLSEN